MDGSFNEIINFWYGPFQRQQWEYYVTVTASWVPYHKHYQVQYYVARSFPLCGVKVLRPARMI